MTRASSAAPSERTRVKRFHERARYGRQALLQVLDAGVLCHVAFQAGGEPVVLPTLYWHDGERLYFHGSSASRMSRAIEGQRICVAVTHLDGLVLARSAFHHSANYRSAVIFGVAERYQAPDGGAAKMRDMIEHLFPGRWDTLRPVTAQELKATWIYSLSLDEASVKCRAGPPDEPDADRQWPVWAGLVPMQQQVGEPEPDAYCTPADRCPEVSLRGGA